MSTTGSEIEDLPLDTENITVGESNGDFISGPILSEKSTLPRNILEFDYSYGYDCKRYYNLTVADENTLIFASGNLINFFDIETRQFQFRRSAFGKGIGHITKNPSPQYSHIAVAENGCNPPIVIYEWPSFKIVCLLKNGAAKSFTHSAYSSDGMLLASQSGEPDFLITVYEWTKLTILLQTKSHVDEVHRLMFSPTVPECLVSCGNHHIKFWKMVKTFSGLRFQGQLGRFGTTEYSDILGVYPMPDQKIVSGCEWGNILLWENGLIKVEVSRRLNKNCHEAPVTHFLYSNGDLWSIGMDGWIKIWYYKHLDLADPPEEDRLLLMEPTYQFHIPEVMFMCVHKQNDDPMDTLYFAQDGNGGLWHIDLNIQADPQPPVQLYKCHAGAIADIAACPWGTYLASLGIDGRVQIYHYVEQKLLFMHKYPAKGSALIWLPLNVQQPGDQLIMGFDDGNLRVVVLNISDPVNIEVKTIQITKPHNGPITKLALNKAGTLLVTGSEDATIFVYGVKAQMHGYVFLVPIGYVPVPGIVTCLTWNHKDDTMILIGCINGHFIQVQVPTEPQTYTTISYLLKLNPKQQKFTKIETEVRTATKVKKLRSEELEPHTAETPNQVLWMQTTDEDTIWLSMGGDHAGYIYEYHIDQTTETPSRAQKICDAEGIEISSYVYNDNKKYLILAMQDGSVRVVKVNPNDWRDFSNYWQLSMHDNQNGFIPRMCFSYDQQYFFTCGHDGNIFSNKFNPEGPCFIPREQYLIPKAAKQPIAEVPDLNGYTNLSLEETKAKAENDRIQKDLNEHQTTLLEKLDTLRKRFKQVLERNENLKASQVIPRAEFEIDPRITADLNQSFSADLELVRRKLAFEVEKSRVGMEKLKRHFTDAVDLFPICVKGVQTDVYVTNARQRKLADGFNDMMEIVKKKIAEAEQQAKWEQSIQVPQRPSIVRVAPPPTDKEEKQLEQFLNGLSPSTIQFKLGPKLAQLLHKYRLRKLKIIKRQQEWNEINALKPTEGLNDSKDEATLAHARETIGDYKLKSALNYKVPRHLWESTVKKYKQLLDVRLRQYQLRHNFNLKVYELRQKKVELHDYLMQLNVELDKVRNDLDEAHHKPKPILPEITDEDFPEKNLEVVVQTELEEIPDEKEIKIIVQPPKSDLLEQEVLIAETKAKNPEGIKPPLFIEHETGNFDTIDFETIDVLSQCCESDTSWEKEMRNYRQTRKLFEQDLLLEKMQKAIKAFDNSVQALAQEKLQVTRDADFLDLHLLTLYQELYILKDSEADEEKVQRKVHVQMQEVVDVGKVVNQTLSQINGHKIKVSQLQEDVKSIKRQFNAAIIGCKFSEFLKRIFRKTLTGSNEISSSENSTSLENTDQNGEATENLDENICPEGCDPNLYNKTFELRSKRHAAELEIKDQSANIELLKKELNISFNKVDIIVNNLKQSHTELELFQREKQKKLNEVMCTVVLNLHQLQHLDKQNQANKIGDTLLFSKSTLSKLYKRVGKLHNETLLQKIKHKTNMTHLCRMKTDCRYMERMLEELKAQIVEKMKIKFGREVNLNELEEAQLQKMVFDLRMSRTDIRGLYEQELKLWKEKYEQKQKELKQTIQENTKRLGLLATVNHEKAQLIRALARQSKKKEHLESVSEIMQAIKHEIEKLSEIVQNQNKETEILRDEIKRLSLKGQPTTKDLPKEKYKAEEEEEPMELFQWKDWGYDLMRERSAPIPLQLTKKKKVELEGEERESRIFTTEVQIPSVLPDEAEDAAKTIIMEMLLSLGTHKELSTSAVESLIEQTLQDVLGQSSVDEIVDNLTALMPEDATEEQQAIIETTAERIFALQEPAETEPEDIWKTSREILDEIIEDMLLADDPPQEMIVKLLLELVEQLPVDFLLKKDTINTLIEKMNIQSLINETDREELMQTILNIASEKSDEVRMVFNRILEVVFGTGADYLFYYIKP